MKGGLTGGPTGGRLGAVATLYLGLATLGTTAVQPQTGTRNWRPEERVVLRDYSYVLNVAASNTGLFVVTTGGLAVYDPRFGTWMSPVTESEGFPIRDVDGMGRVATAPALADPADESLWFGARDVLVHYMPLLRLFERIPLRGPVQQLMFDEQDPFRGLYVRAGGEWNVVQRGATVPTRALELPPPGRHRSATSVEDVLQRYPAADAMQVFATVEDGRRYRYTAAAVDPATSNAYLGTNGSGIIRYDAGIATVEPLTFGLVSDGAGAVVTDANAVWVGSVTSGGTGMAGRSGFTWVTEDFQQTRWELGPGRVGFRFGATRDLAVWQGAVWAATDVGLWRFDGGRPTLIDRGAGLPANDVYALAASAQALWVGTARGLVSIEEGGVTVTPVETFGAATAPVTSLALDGDTLWVAGPWGVTQVDGGGRERVSRVPASYARDAIVGVAVVKDHVIIALRDQVVWRGRDGSWSPARPLGGLGDVTTLAADEDGVWIGGMVGVQFFDIESRGFTVAAGAGDLPGEVRDIAVSDRYVWIATLGGLVRLERDAVHP